MSSFARKARRREPSTVTSIIPRKVDEDLAATAARLTDHFQSCLIEGASVPATVLALLRTAALVARATADSGINEEIFLFNARHLFRNALDVPQVEFSEEPPG